MTDPKAIADDKQARLVAGGALEVRDGALVEIGEERLIRMLSDRFAMVADERPDWWAYFEDCQAFTAPKEDILELARCAPNDFAAGVMYGIYLMRQELAVITGRDFL